MGITKTAATTDLLPALYKIWDVFGRANVRFFLVGQTAEDAIKNHDLSGDAIHVGVRRNEWVSGGRRILDALITPEKEDKDSASYNLEGAKVVLHIYDDSPFVTSPDMVRYKYEAFYVPNPYDKFKELYG